MQADKSNDQPLPSPTHPNNYPSINNQQAPTINSNINKDLYESDILPMTNRVIKNSSSYNNSLLNKLEMSRSDDQPFPSQKGSKSIKEYRNSLTYLKLQVFPGEFIAYCIVNKESSSGIVSHERLIVVDSKIKELKYYSQIPSLPIKKAEELGAAKETVNMINAKKFVVSPLKNRIGEVEISWIESGKLKKWNIKMGNSQVSKDFCYLIDSVKNNRYLKERIIVKPPPSPSNRVNTSKTHFIADVLRLEEKKESNRSKSNSIQQSFISRNQEEKEVIKVEEEKIEEDVKKEQAIQEVILQENTLKVPQGQYLGPNQSIRSIKIQQIIKQAEEHSAPRKYKQPEYTPIVIKDYHSQYKSQKEYLKVPEVISIQKKSRNIQAEEQSITTIKHMHKEQEDLGMSKRLVMSIHRKLTNKEELAPNKEKEKEKERKDLSQYYRSQRPTDIAQNHRQTLLQERRYTELAQKQKQRKTYILNQHIYPKQQKSRSRSKGRQLSTSNMLIQRDWLVKWLNAKDKHQRAEIYSRFVDHCLFRVEKLTQSFANWHLFHKKAELYIIKEDNIEFTYQMLSLEEKEENFMHEQEMINKMENLNFMWRIVNELIIGEFKFAVPLACLIRYKGLKVYCKVQLASNSLRIEEIQDKLIYDKQLFQLQQATKGLLRHYSLFLLASNQSKWLYVNQVDLFLKLDIKGYSINHSQIQKYIKNRRQYEVQHILLHLNKTVIPSFLNTLNQTQPLSTHDFGQLMKAHHLNSTLLPLIFNKSIEMRTNKATKWIISQICSIFLQQQIRQRIHFFLMKKERNKSLSKELYFIFAQSLRWNEENLSLNKRLKAYIDTELSTIQQEIIDEYVISSLLHKLSLSCNIKNIPLLQVLQKKEYSFWREFQFEPESIQLAFTSAVSTYDYRYFSEKYEDIETILKGVPSTKMSQNEFQIILSKLSIPKEKDYKKGFIYKLLPLSLKQKISQYETFIKNTAKETCTQSRFPKSAHPVNTQFYFSIDCFKFAAQTANRYIKLKKFQQCEGLIRAQLIRAWIWSRNRPNVLVLLYDLNTSLSLQRREQADSLSSCLKCLQLVLSYYQQGLVSITVLMQKIFKAAQVHSIFNDHQQSLNLYRASLQIYENMITLPQISQHLIIKYMSIYYSVAVLLMTSKRIDQSIKKIKENLQFYSKLKQEMRNEKYEVLARIHSEQFQNYLLMLRCYELVGKKMEMLQVVEECCVKFIENYVALMVKNGQSIDVTCIPQYRFVEIVKNIWYAILLNCSSKNMTYQQYFSKTYSTLKLINLNSVRDVVLAIQKQCQESLPFQPAKAIEMIILHIHQTIPKSNLQKISTFTMSSIFVQQCIKCLKILSSSAFLQSQTLEQQQTNSKSLAFISSLLSLLGYEYCLGSFSIFFESQQ